jgi:nitrite reductase/ring-hydroxylating ferredoxin subunit
VDWWSIRADHPAKKVGVYHMILNVLAVVVYAVDLVIRSQYHDVEKSPITPFVLSLIGVLLLSVSSYLGGVMVYDDGVAVGRHRRKTPTPAKTIKPNVADAIDGWVAIAPADTLRDKETLRVEVASTVMTIARCDGQLFAVQEFCTHRFGPLSEGAIHDCQIECPWHRSCFDLRTGNVTHGPAKEDLRTFDVQERDAQIWVRVPLAAEVNHRTIESPDDSIPHVS